ncbi:anthrone oxygenase family protein [Streptomyces luteireticuli]|uniref:anthrone oxygenase family protein n=1 Tax=Streptomyces luteireticuli TaxID=173858 RepID=UPI0035590676
MIVDVLASVLVLLSGVLAGVLVAVQIAVVPMLAGLPGKQYVEVHRLLDPRFDPLMPTVDKIALGAGLLLVVLVPGGGARAAFGVAEAGLAGVALVSELSNVRINRAIAAWDADRLPDGWSTDRSRWARSNLHRSWLALAAFAAALAGLFLV